MKPINLLKLFDETCKSIFQFALVVYTLTSLFVCALELLSNLHDKGTINIYSHFGLLTVTIFILWAVYIKAEKYFDKKIKEEKENQK